MTTKQHGFHTSEPSSPQHSTFHLSEPSLFPSVQELSLTLSADIEIHRLWKTITEILSQHFHATRITLCLPQDPTVPSSTIEICTQNSRPWGLKARWDSKRHFLDENTVTPRDEFAHQHHRLHKSSSTSSDSSRLQNVRPAASMSSISLTLSSTSSSTTSSTRSPSLSRRWKEANANGGGLSINLSSSSSFAHNPYGSNSSSTNSASSVHSFNSCRGYTVGSEIDRRVIDDESCESFKIQDGKIKDDYHQDYWNTASTSHDGGYSSSTSSISSYSSTGSAALAGAMAQGRGFSLYPEGTECFAHLQSLQYDPEPLLNEDTINSILVSGKTVVLTREYNGSGKRRRSGVSNNHRNGNQKEHRAYRSKSVRHGPRKGRMGEEDDSIFADTDATDATGDAEVDKSDDIDYGLHSVDQNDFEINSDADSLSSQTGSEGSYFPPVVEEPFPSPQSLSAGFVDFIQGLNPAWSQSPAPSPNIIKEDPTINPFFFQPLVSYPKMDDDTFDPPDHASDYTNDGHSSASEQDHVLLSRSSSASHSAQSLTTQTQQQTPSPPSNSHSLIHLPLYRSTDFNHRHLPSDVKSHRPPVMPVGIISVMSDQVPYPPKALDIVTDLSTYLANQITNALRMEDMMARSKRWGEPNISALKDRPRSSEAFSESILRKMKDNIDPQITKPSATSHRSSTQDIPKSRSSNDEWHIRPSVFHVNSKPDPLAPSTIGSPKEQSQNEQNSLDRHNNQETPRQTPDAISSSAFQSPYLERHDNGSKTSPARKKPESYYNLDSTTDEIHRSLNFLNLDVTGSATCPLAPQTKKMLGRQPSGSRSQHSIHIKNMFLGARTNEQQWAEASHSLPNSDSTDPMWQTLSPEEDLNLSSSSLPNLLAVSNDFDSLAAQAKAGGLDSPYYSSAHSISPTNTAKRHQFSTNKRSGIRRRRKSVKETTKQPSQPNSSGSPLPTSPYTPTAPDFHPQSPDPTFPSAPVPFSPQLSPMSSSTIRNKESSSKQSHHRQGHHLFGDTSSRVERTPLSRHGSGWSFNSDDTSHPSPGIHEKHTLGRKQKRHHTHSAERSGHNPFPRTRLLRLIVDAIAHHVFTLSPQTGCLTWLNQRSLQYAGSPLSQLLHSSWTRLLHDEDRDRFWPLFKESFDRGEMFNAQYRVLRFDGQYRWFLGRILPVRDYGGNIVHWFGTSTDIHDQKLAELQLNRQVELEVNEKKYRLLAEAIPQIVFTAAPQIGLTFANAKWFTYSGQVFEQACGLGFMDHVHPDDRAKCFLPTNISEGSRTPPLTTENNPNLKHSTTPGSSAGHGTSEVSYQTELRLKRKDGKFRWFLVKCISVEVVEQGRKWFGTCTDINDHKLLEQKLKEAHDAAQKSTESKTRFLSNMSHEIRTPLVGITGMINFLITTDLTSEQLDYVHTVQQSADALLLVINDILDLSKVEAGMMKLEMEPFSVHTMIEGANELLSTLAIQKGLELGFLVENEVPEVVVGDRVRLRQVLINIIGNAIKFTTNGEVFSRCSVSPTTLSNDPEILTIKFEISDTGKGFDESERAVMFKPFSQVDTSSTRKHGGTGLGLVLSKEFVELHGGEISCHSVKGTGSTFSFTFKARLPSPNTPTTALTPCDDIHVAGHVQNQSKGNHTSQLDREQVMTTSIELKLSERPALRHISGFKLVPGEASMTSEDLARARDSASDVRWQATESRESLKSSQKSCQKAPQEVNPKPSLESNSPPGDLCTAMTRTESILDDRRYLKVGQLTPSNPPLGEPLCVAVIAANLPNPALEMKLTIPAKVLENKALAAESKKSAFMDHSNPSTAITSDFPVSSTNPARSPSIRSQPVFPSSAGTQEQLSNMNHPSKVRILVIADLLHARDTILHLLKQLIPKQANLEMDVATDLKQGVEYLVGGRKSENMTGPYSYVVINLASYMSVMDIFSIIQKDGVLVEPNVLTCVITTPIQRTALMEAVKVEEASFEVTKSSYQSPSQVIPSRVEWVFKPLTKSKLHLAFADLMMYQENTNKIQGSTSDQIYNSGADGQDLDRSGSSRGSSSSSSSSGTSHGGSVGRGSNMTLKSQTAQQVVVNQKEVFSQMKEDMKGRDIRILMAEDDLINQKVIRRYFQFVGAELVITNDGNECLEKFKSYPPGYFSLVLCDLFMPGRDGYATTRAIRTWEDEHLQKDDKRIPIVALSANVMANVTERCLSSGFTSYLSKPVDFRKLSETLRQLLLSKS
ncbi:hypothetical protein BG004_001065 [Podila humilis]|nr:hypothetical protein BG004_001065 [Podila humilis]